MLLLDNHSLYLSIAGLDFAKENGVVMLSFPTHYSHKLQPLDRTVFGPLKKAVNRACDSWMVSNPGKSMTIYDIPGILTTAYPQAMTIQNIQSGCRTTGIWPFNRDIFSDTDFAPSLVTDREYPIDEPMTGNSEKENEPTAPGKAISPQVDIDALARLSEVLTDSFPVDVTKTLNNTTGKSDTKVVSSKDLRPFPKAGPKPDKRRVIRKVKQRY